MTSEQQREQFSISYVRAVAATAGVNVYEPIVDQDSIDVGFCVKSFAGCPGSPRIEAQLKCVSTLNLVADNYRYPLKRKNYEELIGEHYVPRILIVVEAPADPSAWLNQSHDELTLHRCAYWVSLKELQASENESTVTVSIPRTQIFGPMALKSLLPEGAAS
jgi:hypothetical protein